jgi:hypothetical protein
MQTFLIAHSHYKTARDLDDKRLGKQRVETKQILRALEGQTKGWVNHPATKMWEGCEYALAVYGWIMCNEWTHRGFKDTLTKYFVERQAYYIKLNKLFGKPLAEPWWMEDLETYGNVIQSHRSNMLRKNPDFYGKYSWKVSNDLPYMWPTSKKEDE